MPNIFNQVKNAKFLNSDGVSHLWAKIRERFDPKLDRVESLDNSIDIQDNYKIGVAISPKTGNIISVIDDSGEEGIYVPTPDAKDLYVITRLGTANAGASASYKLQQYICGEGEAQDIAGSSTIDIPDIYTVQSGSVENKSSHGEWGDAGTYIHLVLENTSGNSDIYINVDTLIDQFSSGSEQGDAIIIHVDEDKRITATITDGSISKAKLSAALQDELDQQDAWIDDHSDMVTEAYRHASAKGAAFASGLYKITTNSDGHVTKAVAVTKSDITGLGIPGSVPTKVSQLQNDSGFLATETDPTVPAWAKQPTKPTYTAQEVGAMSGDTFIPAKVSDLDNDAGYLTEHQDISGKADKSDIPTKVSELTNDSGYLTQETDPTVPAWAKSPTKPSYTAAEVGAPTIQEMNNAIANVNTMKMHICTAQEYDANGVPTIVTPDEQTLYLVPGGSGSNLFIEWAYVNNAWEKFGSADLDLSGYATKNELSAVATSGSYNDLSDTPVITDIIDDTAGNGDTDVVWSADKSHDEIDAVVTVSDTQPQHQGNKLWIEEDAEETYSIPTYAEMLAGLDLKLDQPAIDGIFGQVLKTNGNGTTYWGDSVDFSIVSKTFASVADMVADTSLHAGDNVATRGYYASGDGGGDNFVISATHTGTFYITLSNGLYANRLKEEKKIRANAIGIKSYTTKNAALADTSSMESNQEIAQATIDAGFGLYFDIGFYAFDDELSMTASTNITGYQRERTTLLFPNSIGLNFNRGIEYHYQTFNEFKIESLGNCINVISAVYNVIHCKFDRLYLISAEGECIVAPPNNNGARGSIDTCVWDCVFTRIHAESKVGAMFANIKGLGNWFYFILMLGDTKWAFRNCTGTFIRMDTGCNHPKVCFYYDHIEDYSSHLNLKEVHFEACEESFIYTEDNTLSTMALGVYAVDSGVTRPQMKNSDKPFMKVGRFLYLYHYGQYNMLPDESYFDMEALHGAIIHFQSWQSTNQGRAFKTNMGGSSGLKMYATAGNGALHYAYGGTSGLVEQKWNPNYYNEIPKFGIQAAEYFYGGRRRQKVTITYDQIPAKVGAGVRNIDMKNINRLSEYCDCVQFDLKDAEEGVYIRQLKLAEDEMFPGRVLTVINSATSTQNVAFEPGMGNGTHSMVSTTVSPMVTLLPGNTVVLYLGYENNLLRWYPIRRYELPDASSNTKGGVMIEDTPTEDSTKAITSGGAYAALALKQDALTFDTAPTQGSTNPVTSGGVYSAIAEQMDDIGISVVNGKLCVTYEEVSAS